MNLEHDGKTYKSEEEYNCFGCAFGGTDCREVPCTPSGEIAGVKLNKWVIWLEVK